MKIFAVGTLRLEPNENNNLIIQEGRLWILCDNFKDAETFLLENKTDCFECNFNYGLIEEHEVNSIYQNLPKRWWYKAIRGQDIFFIVKTKCPEDFKDTYNWWVG